MGRIDLDLAADRLSLWEAAAAALPDAEGEPGRQLLWDDFRMDLVATGRGGTQVRFHHPGGLLASLRWRWWLRRLGASPWGAAEKLALAAGLLTLAAGASLWTPQAEPPAVEVAEAPLLVGSLSAAVLDGHKLRIDRAHTFATLPEPPVELDLRDDGLWVGDRRIPLGVPAEGGGWEAKLDDGALSVVHGTSGERYPVVPPPEHGHIDLATMRGSSDRDQLLAYAVGSEVVVVAIPALVPGRVARGRNTTPDWIHFDDVQPYGLPLPEGFARSGFGWRAAVPKERDGRVFLYEEPGMRWVMLFTGLPGASDPLIGAVDEQLQVAFTVDGELYMLDLTTLE